MRLAVDIMCKINFNSEKYFDIWGKLFCITIQVY